MRIEYPGVLLAPRASSTIYYYFTVRLAFERNTPYYSPSDSGIRCNFHLQL